MTIFAKAADVAQGFFSIHRANVEKVATGVNLGPMGVLANKGVAGLSARYHDCTLAFITAHFASDSKGKNRLERRNKVSKLVSLGSGKKEGTKMMTLLGPSHRMQSQLYEIYP